MPPLSMPLSPASLLLSNVPYNRQFPVLLIQGQNSHTDFLVLYGITSGKITTFKDVLKIRNLTIFRVNFPFIVKQLKLELSVADFGGGSLLMTV
jgi:hypothetical protein